MLFLASIQAVYLRHGKVLKRGGYPYGAFRKAAWDGFRRSFDTKAVRAPAIPEPGSWEEREEKSDVILRWEPILERGVP